MVITNALAHKSFQIAFVHHDDMIEQVFPVVADPAFGDLVLPWAPVEN